MDLTPYLDGLRRDLGAAAAPGGADVQRAADLLAGSLDASLRLCLMQVLADAAADITTRLGDATVDVRLRGRDAELVVTQLGTVEEPAQPPAPAVDPVGDLARVTLRLPEPLKEQVEHAAAAERVSVNAWLVRAIGAAVRQSTGEPTPPPSRPGRGHRITGFAQA
jgi:hypothetical protein